MYASRWTTLGAALVLATSTGCATPGMVPSFAPRQDAADVLERHRAERAEQRGREEEARAAGAKEAVPATELLREGDRYRESNRYADAMFTYLRAARENPTELSPKLRIGFLHLREEPGRSVRIFEALKDEAPQSSELHAGLGLAHFALGAWEPARKALSRAVELDPDSAATRNALGALLDRVEDGEAARDQYRAAHRLDPENAEILGNLGSSYLISGEFELAAEALEHATRIDPDAVGLRNSLGLALGRQGLIDEAFAAFRAAGSESQARNNLGYVYFLNGEYDLAMAEYENAIGVSAEQLPSVLQNWEAAREAGERAEEQARLDALNPPFVAPPAPAVETAPTTTLAEVASSQPASTRPASTRPASTRPASTRPEWEEDLDVTLAEIEREFRALVARQNEEASERASSPAREPVEALADASRADTETSRPAGTDVASAPSAPFPVETEAPAEEPSPEPAALPDLRSSEAEASALAIETADPKDSTDVTSAEATVSVDEPSIETAASADESTAEASASEAIAPTEAAESIDPLPSEATASMEQAIAPIAATESDVASAEANTATPEDVIVPAGATLVATGSTRPGPAPVPVLDAMAAVIEEVGTADAEEAPVDEASPAPADASTAELADPASLDEASAAL